MTRVSPRVLSFGSLLLLVAPTAVNGQRPTPPSLPPALDSLRRAYVHAHNSGDDSTLANLYTTDAAYIGTGGDLTVGRDRIRAGLVQELPIARDFALSDSTDGEAEENLAWERGRWSMILGVPGRPPEPMMGWYLIVYERGPDHRWRIRNQVVTRDRPRH